MTSAFNAWGARPLTDAYAAMAIQTRLSIAAAVRCLWGLEVLMDMLTVQRHR